MKTALLAFVLTLTAHMHLSVRAAGIPLSVPVPALVLAVEVLTATGAIWLVVRTRRRFRSSPYPRTAWGMS